jgi:hypothetical protein
MMKNFRSLRATEYPDRTDFVFVRRPGDVRDWQVRCVCGPCNNGWMRKQIDERARPIMIPLIKGDAVRLSPDQQHVLAAWAVMKAMVAEYGESECVTAHHTHRKYLMRTKLPPKKGWSVWIANYVRKDGPVHWLSTPFLLLPDRLVAKRVDRRATFYNSQVSTQIVGQLFIQVIRSPHPRLATLWRFSLPRGQSIYRIWPPTSYGIRWAAGTIDDASADRLVGAIKEFMARIEAERLANAPGWGGPDRQN